MGRLMIGDQEVFPDQEENPKDYDMMHSFVEKFNEWAREKDCKLKFRVNCNNCGDEYLYTAGEGHIDYCKVCSK